MNKHTYVKDTRGHQQFNAACYLASFIGNWLADTGRSIEIERACRVRRAIVALGEALACAAQAHAKTASKADRLAGLVVYVNGKPLVDATARLKQLHGAARGRMTQGYARGKMPAQPRGTKVEKALVEAIRSLLEE